MSIDWKSLGRDLAILAALAAVSAIFGLAIGLSMRP